MSSGASCSKLTMLLVKISNGNITNTLQQKILTFFSAKQSSVFAYVVSIYLTSWGLNSEVVNKVLNNWPQVLSTLLLKVSL